MLDIEWLDGIRSALPSGHRFAGLQGYGADHVAFRMIAPDGMEEIFKTYVTRLGFHIREIPLDMSAGPAYDVGQLNKKLDRLTGELRLDQMAHDYSRLFSGIMKAAHNLGIGAILRADRRTAVAVAFLCCSAPFAARLDDLASLGNPHRSQPEIVTVNGPSFPFSALTPQLRKFCQEAAATIEVIRPTVEDAQPDKLPDNPLYVWGAAVTDGFFTDEEIPLAVAYLTERYGPLTEHPDCVIWLDQIDNVAYLMKRFLQGSGVDRLVRFCQAAGFLFQP
jgi:hypothetical protein